MNPENQNPLPQVSPPQPAPEILPTPSVPAESPVIHEVPGSKKGFLPVLIVILALTGLGLIGYWGYNNYLAQPRPIFQAVSPSPIATDPTADWKTYSGSVYALKYPPLYTVKEDAGGIVVTLSDTSGVFIDIFSLETLTYDNFLHCTDTRLAGCVFSLIPKDGLIKDVLVDGKNAKSFYVTGLGGDDGYYHNIEVLDSPKTGIKGIIGTATKGKADAVEKDSIFNQIISTFKFVDQTADTTANWKTYNIAAINFVFKYPSDFKVEPQKQLEDDPEYFLNISNGIEIVGILVIHKADKLYTINEDGPKDININEWLTWNIYDNCKKVSIMSGYFCTTNPYGTDRYIFATKTKNRFIELTGSLKNKTTLDQILSTFKFTQ